MSTFNLNLKDHIIQNFLFDCEKAIRIQELDAFEYTHTIIEDMIMDFLDQNQVDPKDCQIDLAEQIVTELKRKDILDDYHHIIANNSNKST